MQPQPTLPIRAELVHVILAANVSLAESHWHKHFATRRLNGEWFEITAADVAELKNITEM
ncbi:MAG TPA: GIY-YIG nuclease family protein [Abditibacterium sp.]